MLTQNWIRQQATEQSYSRGQEYYHSGAVLEIVRRGELVTAQVQGSGYAPYTVTLEVYEDDTVDGECTCPYDWGSWCKHIVAAALALLHQSDTIEERASVDELLEGLDADQLHALLLALVGRRPELADEIELLLLRPPAQAIALPQANSTPLTGDALIAARRQVQSLLYTSPYPNDTPTWREPGRDEPLDDRLFRAWTYIIAGEGGKALVALEAVTKPMVATIDEKYYDDYYGDGDGDGEDFNELGALWIEGVLTAELSTTEKRAWRKKLEGWADTIGEYGYDNPFDGALAALEQGWDYPQLLRVFAGEITEQGAWEGEAPYCADALAIARLNILERQGRYTEYLHLAEAEGQTVHLLMMLARLDRLPELLAYTEKYPCGLDEIFIVTRALQEYGYSDAALELAQRALAAAHPPAHRRAQLAAWLRDQAVALGKPGIAAEAAVLAFRALPALAAYQQALELAGDGWIELRQKLLDELRALPVAGSQGVIEIFLHEGLIDDAIHALGDHAYYDTVRRVVDAAIPTRPDWAIQACRKQAEPIMDGGQAKYYHHAAEWLAKARDAYHAAGRYYEWQQYLSSLLQTHGRKYKLVPMLQALQK